MIAAVTGSSSVTVTVLPNGESHLSSADPWYRYLSALVGLYLDRRISDEWLEYSLSQCSQAVLDHGDQAARQLLSRAFLPFSEPDTPDPHARMVQVILGVDQHDA